MNEAAALVIAGLTPLSTCDWPEKVAATVFLQGCPWRCGYCHNYTITDNHAPGQIPWEQVVDLLGRRRGLLDGLVFSGGEPTRQGAIVDAARQVRELGFGVALHTGGAYPQNLRRLLPYLSWVGLDIKAPPRLYGAVIKVGAGAVAAERAFASLELLLESQVPLQVRTTVDPTVMNQADVEELTVLLRSLGVREHILQEARTTGTRPSFQEQLQNLELGIHVPSGTICGS